MFDIFKDIPFRLNISFLTFVLYLFFRENFHGVLFIFKFDKENLAKTTLSKY